MDLSRKITRTVVPEELTVRRKVQHLAHSNFTYRHYAAWTPADPRVFWHQSQNRQRDIRLDKLNDSESSTHRASQKAQPEDGPFNMDNWTSKGRHPRNGNHIFVPRRTEWSWVQTQLFLHSFRRSCRSPNRTTKTDNQEDETQVSLHSEQHRQRDRDIALGLRFRQFSVTTRSEISRSRNATPSARREPLSAQRDLQFKNTTMTDENNRTL